MSAHRLGFLKLSVLSMACALSLATAPTAAVAGEVEVLHFWTSPGEAESIAQLKGMIASRGHTWRDFAVVGGGGENALAALRQRVLAGNAPAAASIKGPPIQEWASRGVLTNLDAMATFDHWDDVLPKQVQEHVKYGGHYVAVPVNIHRVNWLWINLAVLQKAGVSKIPSTLDEFFAAADKIKAAGFIAVAHGGEPWQEFTLFESIAIGAGGPDFYRKAFIQFDTAALTGPAMRRTLEAFRRVKSYTDVLTKGRDWNVATDMVIQGRAAFQFMGDWAKGEFVAAGRQPGRDFACAPAPGTQTSFSYVIDTFAMFKLRNWEAQKAQGYLAYALMDPDFQQKFNMRKGSIPVRSNVSLASFDDCAKQSRRDFDASAQADTLIPSVAIEMAATGPTQAALRAVVSEFWNNDSVPIKDAIDRLGQAVDRGSQVVAAKKKPPQP